MHKKKYCDKFTTLFIVILIRQFILVHIQKSNYLPTEMFDHHPLPSIQDTKVHGGNSTAPKLFRHTKPLESGKGTRNPKMSSWVINVYPRKSNGWIPKMMNLLSNMAILGVYVKFQGDTHCYLLFFAEVVIRWLASYSEHKAISPLCIPLFSESFSQCLGCVLGNLDRFGTKWGSLDFYLLKIESEDVSLPGFWVNG